ncbi:MAG: hypothetical protein QXQ93_07220 [Ignisphaera sp.]
MKGAGTVTCPRCGQPGYLVHQKKKEYEYVFVVHPYRDETGKRRQRWHSLGPVHDYVHLSKTMNIDVAGFLSEDPVETINHALSLIEVMLNSESLKKLRSRYGGDINRELERMLDGLDEIEKKILELKNIIKERIKDKTM